MALHIYLGPMFSGKSTKLIETYNNYLTYNYETFRPLVINHSTDNRYGMNRIITHNQQNIPCLSINYLNQIINDIHDYTHIFIDEAQFFKDLYDIVKAFVFDYGKIVYIAGLDGDFMQQPFKDSKLLQLIPYAETVTKLTAKCNICSRDAPLTKRITNSTKQILVGGANDYIPVCLNHI